MGAIKKGSFRETVVSLEANIVKEIVFRDTKPTFVQIINNSASQNIYVNNTPNVSPNNYIAEILPSLDKQAVFPDGIQIIYLLTGDPCTAIINSGEGDVEIRDMHQTSDINIVSSTSGTIQVQQVTNPLPTGTNLIGHVIVDSVGESPLPISITNPQVEVSNDSGNPIPTTIIKDAFIPKKFTLSAGVDTTVKAGSGYVAIIQTGLSDLLLKDGSTIVWLGQLQGAAYPVRMGTSIVLNSATGGDAYIAYL